MPQPLPKNGFDGSVTPLTHDQLLAVKQVYSAQQQATAALVAYTEAATAAASSDAAERDPAASARFAAYVNINCNLYRSTTDALR